MLSNAVASPPSAEPTLPCYIAACVERGVDSRVKYAFWNNKGGVGKTFLCFATASEYARQHPDVSVVVMDLCPQANISEILLGGNGGGGGVLEGLLRRLPVARTVGGYYHQRILQPHGLTGTETDFLVRVRDSNENAPENLHLIAGDPSLELQVQTINNIAVQDIPAGAWRNVHSWVIDLQQAATRRLGKCAFFIDCNPSFSAYTAQAVLAAERLVVPCTADGSSARAIHNVGQLVYGHGVPPEYRDASFRARAEVFSMTLPKLHVVALNRSTTYRRKSARAFAKMFDDIRSRVDALAEALPESVSRAVEAETFIEIPDAHTVAIVASHLGVPIGQLEVRQYDLEGERAQLSRESLNRYQASIRKLVGLL